MTAYDGNNKANVICCWASIKNHNKKLISEMELITAYSSDGELTVL